VQIERTGEETLKCDSLFCLLIECFTPLLVGEGHIYPSYRFLACPCGPAANRVRGSRGSQGDMREAISIYLSTYQNPDLFRLISYSPVPPYYPHCPRISLADRIDLPAADKINRNIPNRVVTPRRAMYYGAGHNRRGVNARRLAKQPHGRSTSPDIHHKYNSTYHQTHASQDRTHHKQAPQPARPNLT